MAGRKIITTLRDRRQIESGIRALLACGSELELRREAQRIAALGRSVIPVIIGNLDRADSRLLAAMGIVATYLDRGEVVSALRRAVLARPDDRDRVHTDQGRIGAMTILERFLAEPPGDDLLASLADPQAVALSALNEILAQADGDPGVLSEYVQGLDRQHPDVVQAVVRALRQLGDRRAVEPLRLMAQDVRAEIASAALQALGTLRLPAAAAALQTLIPVAQAEHVSLAERTLRKLQFSGVAVSPLPLPDPDWRALASPVDSRGQMHVWFIRGSRTSSHARFLNVVLSDRIGAAEAAGHFHVATQMLPPRRLHGYVHLVPASAPIDEILMVEVPFDLGRRLIRDALALNQQTQVPVAGPLRLLGSWLWDVGGVESLPPKRLPRLEPQDCALAALAGQADRLLSHPAFAHWSLGSQLIAQAAEDLADHPDWDRATFIGRLAAEIFSGPDVAQVVARRLAANAEWLMWAGDESNARITLAAAEAMSQPGVPPYQQPFIRALVARDLDAALRSLDGRTDSSFDEEQSRIGA